MFMGRERIHQGPCKSRGLHRVAAADSQRRRWGSLQLEPVRVVHDREMVEVRDQRRAMQKGWESESRVRKQGQSGLSLPLHQKKPEIPPSR